jgi:hypothetical protein
MVLQLMGTVLYRLCIEGRWLAITVKEIVLHPLSASYVDTRTGKFVARRPAFGRQAKENRWIGQ